MSETPRPPDLLKTPYHLISFIPTSQRRVPSAAQYALPPGAGRSGGLRQRRRPSGCEASGRRRPAPTDMAHERGSAERDALREGVAQGTAQGRCCSGRFFSRKGAKDYTLYDSVTNQGKITEKKAKNPRTQKTGTKKSRKSQGRRKRKPRREPKTRRAQGNRARVKK